MSGGCDEDEEGLQVGGGKDRTEVECEMERKGVGVRRRKVMVD